MRKKLYLVALVLIIVGVVGLFATNPFTSQKRAAASNEMPDTFTSFLIAADHTDVELLTADDGRPRVEVSGGNAQKLKESLSIEQQGDWLRIDATGLKKQWLSFGFQSFPKITVYLPEKDYETAQLSTAAGDVYAESLAAADIDLTTGSGDIVAKRLTAGRLAAVSNSGDVRLDQLTGDTSVETNSGDLVLSEVKASGVQLKTSSGDTSLKEVSGEIRAESKSGDITIRNKVIADPVQASATSGDIFIQSSKYPKSIRFDTESRVGDIVIFGQAKRTNDGQDPAVSFELQTTTGDIVVREK